MRSATAPKTYHSVIEFCFSTISSVNKCRRDFIIEVLWIFLSVRKLNFTQLKSYTGSCEQRFRNQFSRNFDWLSFNISMVKEHCNDNLAIALDPCYIPRTGKKTQGVGRFWSGCAGKVKHGLEICGLAALDLDNNTAMHLLAKQTIVTEDTNLMELYANCITDNTDKLLSISNIVVADAYFLSVILYIL